MPRAVELVGPVVNDRLGDRARRGIDAGLDEERAAERAAQVEDGG